MKDKYLMTNQEWQDKTQRVTNKCQECGKHYRMPSFIYEPRDKICFTCENRKSLIERLK